jgi:DnaJ-class molecular chaperone
MVKRRGPRTKKCKTCHGKKTMPDTLAPCFECYGTGKTLLRARRVRCYCGGKRGKQCESCKGTGTFLTRSLLGVLVAQVM